MGIKTEGSNTTEPVEGDLQGMERVEEKSHAIVYRIRLEPGEKTGVHQHNLPFTRVYLSGGKVIGGSSEPKLVEAGEFLWQDGLVEHHYENAGDKTIEIVEVQSR